MANTSTIVGTPITTAVATDPDLCRVSGYVKNAQGQALAGWGFTLRYLYTPLGLGTDTLILQERIALKTDASGYVEFDLIRTAELTLELPNLLAGIYQELKVPNAASVDLMAFLFPYLVSVAFEDTTAVALDVGEKFTVVVKGTLSNGEVVDVPSAPLTLLSSNTAVVDVSSPSAPFMFEGLSAGTSNVTISASTREGVEINESRDGVELVFLSLPAVVIDPTAIAVTVS